MSKYTDHLWRDLVREHGPTLAHTVRPEPGRADGVGILRRPRVVAGSTLGLVGVGTALVLGLGGAAATAPAYAVTRSNDGSVLVQLNYNASQNLPQVNRKLAEMGTNEQITIYMAPGAATANGAVACTPEPGISGPTVKVLVGSNGTEVVAAGQSAGNTAEGTFHLDHCTTAGNTGTGNTGNTGAG